jgi:microcystin-dependent protein
MTGVFQWSKTAALNASADPSVNYAEGQVPSSLNDSARNAMTSVANFRDDISGAIVTTGTSAAYIVSSNQGFDTLAHFHGQVIAFTPHTTNAAGPVTMTVDGFANLPLRTAPSTELVAGMLIHGTPYTATYNNTDGALYLQGFFGNPYNIPIGGVLPYIAFGTPNSSFAFPSGQAISRATYAELFSLISTAYGVGDGSTTFNVPDLRGRVLAGNDAMGGIRAGRLTTAYFGQDAAFNGAVGGLESHLLTTAEIPSHTHANSLTDPNHHHTIKDAIQDTVTNGGGAPTNIYRPSAGGTTFITLDASTGITITNAAQGGGGAHNIVQPTIICNYIMRII